MTFRPELPGKAPLAARIAAFPRLTARGSAEKRVKSALLDFIDDAAQRARLEVLLKAHPAAAPLIAGVAGHSPFLLRLMRRDPAALADMLESDPAGYLERERHELFSVYTFVDQVEAMRALRIFRARAALCIALADCGGLWSVDEVTEALTKTADAAVSGASRFILCQLASEGKLTFLEDAVMAAASGITVIAMGKHGAGELNYSSDTDLIILFDPEKLPVAAAREPLDTAVRFAKDLVKLLQERTADGYVLRTDLRLRPDPASTPVAMPVGAAYAYYETVGQNWERAALIKARPCAGDIALGQKFLADLAPFIWRKYFDYAAIADIHAMKRQIYAHKGHETVAIEGHDIKLGRGGIREIEFFVQTQQLVFGGRRPALRGARTLEMLKALAADGWIDAAAVDDLSAAYRFLRMAEHRLQMVNDEQTQRLPRDAEGVDAFAGFCGFTPAAFRKTLTRHLLKVEAHYAQLFEHAPELSAKAGSLVFTGSDNDPETLATLSQLGFARPELVAETIRGWHFGRRPAITTPRAREVVTELVPGLLEAFGNSSNPDGAVLALDAALERMPAVVELFSILKSNQPLRSLFAEILGSAPRLSEMLARRPHVLDAVVDPAFSKPSADSAAVLARLRAAAGQERGYEDFLDRLRYAGRAENFVIGAQMLSGLLPPDEAGRYYAGVADAVLQAALDGAAEEFARRHGRFRKAECAVIAYGKLGSRELTAASDLDLVLLYDKAGGGFSDGEKPLYASDYYSRLAQRLVSALSAQTRAGALYEADLRLRPAGNKGPVAVPLSAFTEYQMKEAEPWEHMALTRARFSAGDAALGRRAEKAVAAIIAAPRDVKRLRNSVSAMRALVADEKGDSGFWDMKLAPGGLFDIEFVLQFLTLAASAPPPPGADCGALIQAHRAAGRLTADQADSLAAAWRLQTALSQIMRLCLADAFDPQAAPAALKRKLAAVAALPDFKILERELKEARRKVSAVSASVLSRRGNQHGRRRSLAGD